MIEVAILVLIIAIIVVLALIINKLHKKKSLSSKLFANGVRATSACAYILGGSNTAKCKDWKYAFAMGNPCVNDYGDVVNCADALACCNSICTCDGGKDCVLEHDPTKNPQSKYDTDANGQCYDQY